MAVQVFVKIDGAPGESVDSAHGDWIEAHRVDWGLNRVMSKSQREDVNMMAASPRVNFEPFSFTKAVDTSTPKLMQLACKKDPVGVSVEFCRAGGDNMKYLEFKFSGCRITGIKLQTGDTDESLPVEAVQFDYEKVTITYMKQKRATGASSGTVVATWDLKANS